MVNKYTSTATAAILLLTSVQGHMVMNTPHSYNLYNSTPLLQVNPLDGAQYKYPCQNLYTVEERGTVKAGYLQRVNFTGGAQHGGGSCQFSISYDDPEQSNGWNTSATFKTIYTIIGGCPAKFSDAQENSKSNLPLLGMKDPSRRDETLHCNGDTEEDCTRQFLIPIPDFLPPGKATFAWTWFNKIGNREMYMNCAPIEITSSKPSQEKFSALPNIFIANLPQKDVPNYDGCVTGGGAMNVVNIPNPGEFGRVGDKLTAPDQPAAGKLCANLPPFDKPPKFKEDKRTLMEGGGHDGGPTVPPSGGEVNAGASATATATGTAKPPAVTTTSAPAAGATGTKTKTKSSFSIVPISSASASASVGVQVDGASGTFITAPSDGSAPTATASVTGGTGGGAAESGSGGAEKSEGGECHDTAATETGAGAGEGDAETTIKVTTSMTLMVTITTAGPPAASASASGAVTTSQAPGAGAGSGAPPAASASAFASASASTASAVPSGLGDSANNAAGNSGSGSGGANDGGPKKCEKDQVSVCFGDDYFGLCDHGWAVPQRVSQGTRCENGSLVHSAVQREGGKRAEGYARAAGERHARRHLKRRAGSSI